MTLVHKPHKDEQGRLWFPYSVQYKADGMRFTFVIYALSGAHAEMILDDIKESAEVL